MKKQKKYAHLFKKKIMIVPMSVYKSIKKTALKWRQKMEEAPRHLRSNDLSDEAFINGLRRALWKRGKSLDVQGDSYIVIEE